MTDPVWGNRTQPDLQSSEDVAQAKEEAHKRQLIIDEALKAFMSLPGGRYWMRGMLEACHIGSSSFTPDALRMSFLEGERNIGLRLFADLLRVAPNEYAQMMKDDSNGE